MMEGNKDEAERCIELAEIALLDGKYDKAEKFLHKSERLYSTQKARDLLDRVQRMQNASKGTSQRTPEEPTVKRRAKAAKKEEPETTRDYTPEQLEAVKRIKSCKDYYEILGVSKESTDSEIKKAYKKLALSLHPDKNKAPGASEAFKALGNAVAILTDPEKKKQYDLFGPDDERPTRNHHTHYETYSRGFESEMTAEELFNMFFGSTFSGAGGNVYVRTRGNQWRRAQEHESRPHVSRETNNYTMIMQMLPVLLLIGVSMMSSLLVSDPVYSLSQSQKYPVLRTTSLRRVPYYVKENFLSEYQGSMRRLEASVEEEHIVNLRNACHRERTYKESLIWKAQNFGDSKTYQKAKTMRTPSCDHLDEIIKGAVGG